MRSPGLSATAPAVDGPVKLSNGVGFSLPTSAVGRRKYPTPKPVDQVRHGRRSHDQCAQRPAGPLPRRRSLGAPTRSEEGAPGRRRNGMPRAALMEVGRGVIISAVLRWGIPPRGRMPPATYPPCMPADPDRRCELGWPGPMRDRLVAAVLRDEKTATSSLLSEWHSASEKLPSVGERQTLVGSDGRPCAVIEIVGIDVMPLGDADLDLARAEGEGFGSVEEWREAHERFWTGETGAARRSGWRLDDDTQVVVERFHVIARVAS